MIDERLQEQAALHVFGALDPDATPAFEAQLAANDELRRHVDALTETAAQLAHTAPARALPAHLEARVLAEIRGTKTPVAMPAARASWLPWALAASLAVACLIAFADRQRLKQDLATAETQSAETQSQLSSVAAEKERAEATVVELQRREADARTQMATLAAARDKTQEKLAAIEQRDALARVQVATLSSKLTSAPDATAVVVWDAERQRGVLNTVNVPPNAADRDYQLWVVDPRYGQPVSAGVFSVEKDGNTRYAFTPKARITSATAFAISLERKGGVPKAEGPIVLAGK